MLLQYGNKQKLLPAISNRNGHHSCLWLHEEGFVLAEAFVVVSDFEHNTLCCMPGSSLFYGRPM